MGTLFGVKSGTMPARRFERLVGGGEVPESLSCCETEDPSAEEHVFGGVGEGRPRAIASSSSVKHKKNS